MPRGLYQVEPQERDQFALFVQSVIDYAIFMLDTRGNIVTWNEGAQRIKGYSAEEIIGQHFSIFYPAEACKNGKPERVLEVAKKEGRYEEEGWRIRKDGTRFWASVVITALHDESGRLCGFGKVTRDLTERHRQEVEREAARQRESTNLHEHANRMAELERAKAEFLNLASHELRGPLAVVRGYNAMIGDGSIKATEIPGAVRIIEDKLAQMEILIEQMLETARLEDGDVLRVETVNLASVVTEQVEKYQSLARGHKFRVVGADQEVLIKADRGRIATVVSNLLDNAIKYSSEGTEVVCTIGQRSSDAFLEVSDQGIGIAPEHVGRLFTRFGRLPTEANVTIPGTGLGLFLCRELAIRHGGDVAVTSQPGAGSQFLLTLPALLA